MNRDKLKRLIASHEAYKQFAYDDATGKDDNADSGIGKITIGIGRNIEDRGISVAEAQFLLDNDIDYCINRLSTTISFFKNLDEVRQAVLIDMAINMGCSGILKFDNSLSYMENGDFNSAAAEMLKSKWASQVGKRAVELSIMMKTGSWPRGY